MVHHGAPWGTVAFRDGDGVPRQSSETAVAVAVPGKPGCDRHYRGGIVETVVEPGRAMMIPGVPEIHRDYGGSTTSRAVGIYLSNDCMSVAGMQK